MANPAKYKGDRGEREAVPVLVELLRPALGEHAARLLVAQPQRKLGAGRAEDTGDLWVLRDAAVQVKNMKDLSVALRTASHGAREQAGHGELRYALGMAPIPQSRAVAVRWLASCLQWPVDVPADGVAVFGNPMFAVRHARNERIGVPRRWRIARVDRAGKEPMWVAPLEAWVAAYAAAHLAEFEVAAADACRFPVAIAG